MIATWDRWREVEQQLREAQEAVTRALSIAEAARIEAAEREVLSAREVALREVEAGN